jgi:uncharacterized protein
MTATTGRAIRSKQLMPRRDRKHVAPIPPPFDQVMELFNARRFRACVEPLEVLYFADRNTFFQGLLHLVVALLQTQLGLVRGPRIRLASAAALLAPYAPWHRGLDVAGLLAFIETCLERLPEGIVQVATAEMQALRLPTHRLGLSIRPGSQSPPSREGRSSTHRSMKVREPRTEEGPNGC